MGADAEAEGAHLLQGVPVGCGGAAVPAAGVFGVAEGVDVDLQAAGGGHGGVELADGAGGGVAGIGVEGFVIGLALAVEVGEGLLGHEDFAAYFEAGRGIFQQGKGDGGDGAEVVGNVFAAVAVAAGGALGEAAVFVGEGYGEAVYLEFADEVEGVFAEEVGDAAMPGGEFFRVEGVGEAEHGEAVPHLGKAFGRGRADALGGGFGDDEFGVLFLQGAELAHEVVELGVGDFGGVQRVIAVVVVVYLLAELVDAVLGLGVHGWLIGGLEDGSRGFVG